MSVTTSSFRAQFREFKDPIVYPNESIDSWVSLAQNSLNGQRWGERKRQYLGDGHWCFAVRRALLDDRTA